MKFIKILIKEISEIIFKKFLIFMVLMKIFIIL